MTRHPHITVFLTAMALGGCTAGPNYRPPELPVPAAWTDGSHAQASPDGPWWESFGDPILTGLVARSAAANTDLRIAVHRLREARAQRGVVSAALLPQVDLNGSFSNSRFSENGFLTGLREPGSEGGLPGAIAPGQQINLCQVGLDASWEIDIFGRNRRAVEAADAEIAAAGFGVGDVLLTVAAEVADGYAQLRGVQARLALAHRTLAAVQETLSVVTEQASAGLASDLDLSRAQTQVYTTAARIPDLEAAERTAVRRLEVLIGAMPGTLDSQLSRAADIPSSPEALDAGIPSDVLRRRPDVRIAERRLASATARVGVATADLFPRFSLTGSFGLQSQELGNLPSGDSRFWAIGPSVRWPILDFGRVRANIRVQDARSAQALAAYEGTVLRALSDVEIALVRLSRERARAVQLDRAAGSARRSTELAEELYRGGLLEFLDLLDARRTQYLAEDAATQATAAVVSDTVALYRALGGGWQEQAESTQAAANR
jgi:NodT family efflux transporter outer membrane factor (OMF) lipoprotein